jgi:MFS family permease
VKLRDANDGVGRPEYRLPLALLGTCLLPLAIAAYGWATYWHISPALLLLTVAVLGFTFSLGFLPLMAYVVDATGIYSASAMTGLIVTRCLMGTFLPLATDPLVDALGYGWGFSVLAGLCLVLTPILGVVLRYGHWIRKRSKYTRDA